MLKDKKILVTGASGTIGRAVALECARLGAKVIIGYNQGSDKAESLKAEISTATTVQLNFLKPQEMVQQFSDKASELSDLFGFVNCSGVHIAGPLISLSPEEIEKQIAINLTGTIHLTQQVCKLMVRKKRGSIILMGSVSAHRTFRGHSVYSASKAGLEGFTRALASEVAKRGVRVNCLLPGPVMSDMLKTTIDETGYDPAKDIPQQRLIEAKEVAESAVFLLSEQSLRVTGTSIPVDGGYLLW